MLPFCLFGFMLGLGILNAVAYNKEGKLISILGTLAGFIGAGIWLYWIVK